jgi:hypothetical protein
VASALVHYHFDHCLPDLCALRASFPEQLTNQFVVVTTGGKLLIPRPTAGNGSEHKPFEINTAQR